MECYRTYEIPTNKVNLIDSWIPIGNDYYRIPTLCTRKFFAERI